MHIDNNSDEDDKLEFTFKKRTVFLFIVLFWASVFIPLSIVAILSEGMLAVAVLFIPLVMFGILIYGLYATWSMKTKILITSFSLEIFVDRTPFLELRWETIESIIIFTEKREIPIQRYQIRNTATGYSLRVKGYNLDKIIRLWCLGFRLPKQKKIVSFLKKTCQTKNILIFIDESPKALIGRSEHPCGHITNFRKAIEAEKKEKKKIEKAVNGGHFF